MTKTLLISALAVVLPIVTFAIASWLVMEVAGRSALNEKRPELKKGLGMRLSGYTVDDAKNYWALLGKEGQPVESRFLKLDLIFAVVYCSAIALSLYAVWMRLGFEASPVWILVPILVALLSDWTETVLQLNQINVVMSKGLEWTDAGFIRIANIATIVKLWSIIVSSTLLLSLVAGMIVCEVRSPSS